MNAPKETRGDLLRKDLHELLLKYPDFCSDTEIYIIVNYIVNCLVSLSHLIYARDKNKELISE